MLYLQLPTAAASAQAAQPSRARQAQEKPRLQQQQQRPPAAAAASAHLLLLQQVVVVPLRLPQRLSYWGFPHPCYRRMLRSPPRWAARLGHVPQTCPGAPQRAGPRLGAAGSQGQRGCQVPLQRCQSPRGQLALLHGHSPHLPCCSCSCLEDPCRIGNEG